jgi:hypothetical protein
VPAWADDYLALIREAPDMKIPEAADRLGLAPATLRSRLSSAPKVRDEAREIRDLSAAREKLMGADPLRAERAEEGGIEEDVPQHLLRFLELWTDPGSPEAPNPCFDNRVETGRRMRVEGIDHLWDDVEQAIQTYPGFARAYWSFWKEGDIEVEDQGRKRARAGKSDAAIRSYLAANMPGKYGAKVKIEQTVTHQLGAQDRKLIDGIRKQFMRPMQLQASVEPEVVEGSVE